MRSPLLVRTSAIQTRFFLLTFILCFFSCKKDEIAFGKSTILATGVTDRIASIQFIDSLHGYASGGFNWSNGYILHTQDGGLSWQKVHTSDKIIEKVSIDTSTGQGFACGLDGIILQKSAQDQTWYERKRDYRTWYRSIAPGPDSLFFLVSGESYNNGTIQRFGPSFSVPDTTYYGANELSDICKINQDTWLAAGIGWVLLTSDRGATWQRKDLTGAFFKAIHFPTETTGFLAADGGEIYRSMDGGRTWDRVARLGRQTHLTDLHFTDAQTGYVCGTGGQVFATSDGGANWSQISNVEELTWRAIFAEGDKIWVGTDQGQMILLER